MSLRWVVSGVAALLVAGGVATGAVAVWHGNGPPQPGPADALPSASHLPIAGHTPSTPGTAATALPASPPVRLDIAAIGVHTAVGSVGLTPSGVMEVPTAPHYDEAAWYRYSPTPGASGPAVIVGHVDSKRGPSVFYRLGALHVGDVVSVRRTDGRSVQFAVRSVRRFSKSDFPTDLVYGDTAAAELRLITCGGSFDNSSGHYRDNIVVFASMA